MAMAQDADGRYADSTGDAIRPAAFILAAALLLVSFPQALAVPDPSDRLIECILVVTLFGGQRPDRLVDPVRAAPAGRGRPLAHVALAAVPTAS